VTRAVFLDRDGVINDPVMDPVDGRMESPLDPATVALADGAVDGLRALRDAGWMLIAASNQPAASKGKTTRAALDAVHERVVALLDAEGVALDEWRYCFDHPEATDPALRGCGCRKPAPGMLLDAARDHGLDLAASWIVGDTDADVGAGRAAGCRTVLVTHPDSAHRRSTAEADADVVVRSLAEAAEAITA
jgi:D-glycero-D-manno-heptose 1,7-bisphosphate phosphatase